MTFGLKVNCNKTRLFSVRLLLGDIESMVKWLGCKASTFPFSYLDLQVGMQTSRIENWKLVMENLNKRLAV